MGISVASDACSAILVRGSRVRWSARVAREPNAPVASLIADLLARAPLHSSRNRLAVAVGPSSCQLKRIHGLPPTLRTDVAARIVRENSASFFLRSSARLVTTGIERGPDGSAWCAALDASLVDEVVDSVRAARLRPAVFLPEPLAAANTLPPGSHRLFDGDVTLEFTTTDRGALAQVRRHVEAPDAAPPATLDDLPPALRALGDSARFYVSAYGAAIWRADRALAWRPPTDPRVTRRWRRAQASLAAVMLACSVGAALVAPGARASRDTEASMRLIARRQPAAEGARVEGELRRVTAALDRIDRFASRRGDVPLLLGELAATLPESTALLSARIDTVEVNLSVLTQRAADVVAALAGAQGAVSPRIVGSVIRDASAREPLERATIRFRRRRR